MRQLSRALGLALVVVPLLPLPALARDRAGIVTSAQGRVTVARTTETAAAPLKFRDEVFIQDRVSTGVDSLARMLLGGKAVITIREHSSVTITEVPGKSIVEVGTGRMALSVARERMKPGEAIEVRTPNAVASVRGTVVVTEVSRVGTQFVSSFTVVRGTVGVSRIDSQSLPVGAMVTLGERQQAGVEGTQPVSTPQTVSPQVIQQLTADFSVKVPVASTSAGMSAVAATQITKAVSYATAIVQSETPVAAVTPATGSSTTAENSSEGTNENSQGNIGTGDSSATTGPGQSDRGRARAADAKGAAGNARGEGPRGQGDPGRGTQPDGRRDLPKFVVTPSAALPAAPVPTFRASAPPLQDKIKATIVRAHQEPEEIERRGGVVSARVRERNEQQTLRQVSAALANVVGSLDTKELRDILNAGGGGSAAAIQAQIQQIVARGVVASSNGGGNEKTNEVQVSQADRNRLQSLLRQIERERGRGRNR